MTTQATISTQVREHEDQYGTFLRAEPDGSVEFVPHGNAYGHALHWTGYRHESCAGASCSLCSGGWRRKSRVSQNVVVRVRSGWCVKILELGPEVFEGLAATACGHSLDQSVFTLHRAGAFTETEYRVTYLRDLTPKELSEMGGLKIWNLDRFYHPQRYPGPNPPLLESP